MTLKVHTDLKVFKESDWEDEFKRVLKKDENIASLIVGGSFVLSLNVRHPTCVLKPSV